VAGSPTLAADPAWQRASHEYIAAERFNADRPEARVALGDFFGWSGESAAAEAEFAAAHRLDPGFVPAYVNEADLLRAWGKESEAGDVLRHGLEAAPNAAALHYAAALWLIRQHDRTAALHELARAASLAPEVARYAEVYGIALNEFGEHTQAVTVLEHAAQRWPNDAGIQAALVQAYQDRGAGPTGRGSGTQRK